jgi:putative endonuclease
MKDKKAFGEWGERQAADYLVAKGYTVLERNYHTPYGEIDLIVQNEVVTVFVEVKTRSSASFGYPEESINRRMMDHLTSAALLYMQTHPDMVGDWRIDVVSIMRGSNSRRLEIHHFENALSESP